MQKNNSKIQAFTFIELMVSVLIIAILAVIAVPFYFEHAEEARGSKAMENLYLISSAQKLNAPENSGYTNDLAHLQTYSQFTLDDDDWEYSLDLVTDNTFTAIATRTIPHRPDYDGRTITINEKSEVTVDGVLNGPWPP